MPLRPLSVAPASTWQMQAGFAVHAVLSWGGDSDVDVCRSIRRPRGKPAA